MIYARRKIEYLVTSRAIGRSAGSLRGLEKVHTEIGIVALAHILLKVAGIHLTTFLQKKGQKMGGRRSIISRSTHFILGAYWTSPFRWNIISVIFICSKITVHVPFGIYPYLVFNGNISFENISS